MKRKYDFNLEEMRKYYYIRYLMLLMKIRMKTVIKYLAVRIKQYHNTFGIMHENIEFIFSFLLNCEKRTGHLFASRYQISDWNFHISPSILDVLFFYSFNCVRGNSLFRFLVDFSIRLAFYEILPFLDYVGIFSKNYLTTLKLS